MVNRPKVQVDFKHLGNRHYFEKVAALLVMNN